MIENKCMLSYLWNWGESMSSVNLSDVRSHTFWRWYRKTSILLCLWYVSRLQQTVIHHHWVHRRHQKGRCKQCGKSFQSKLSFGNKVNVALLLFWGSISPVLANSKFYSICFYSLSLLIFYWIQLQEIVAISCSWCKTAFHNKENCFNMQRIGEYCPLGIHTDLVVPPSWIVKLPRRVIFLFTKYNSSLICL